MNAHPDSREYRSDTGLFVTMLPYLDCDTLFNAFEKNVPTNSPANRESLTKRPAILKCPTSGTSAALQNLSSRFSGEATLGLNTNSCDYMGNDGTYSNSKPVFGSVRLRVGKLVFERRLHEITDGSTQTLLFWESVGDFLRLPNLPPESMDEKCSSAFSFLTDSSNRYKLTSNTQASTKSYVYAWTGFRIGSVIDYGGATKVVNVSNQLGEPFSMHAGIVPCGMVDGSVRSVHEAIDKQVMMAMATAQQGETIDRVVD